MRVQRRVRGPRAQRNGQVPREHPQFCQVKHTDQEQHGQPRTLRERQCVTFTEHEAKLHEARREYDGRCYVHTTPHWGKGRGEQRTKIQ